MVYSCPWNAVVAVTQNFYSQALLFLKEKKSTINNQLKGAQMWDFYQLDFSDFYVIKSL